MKINQSVNLELRHFDTPLLRFIAVNKEFGCDINITWVNEQMMHLLPIGTKANNNALKFWIKYRAMSISRYNASYIAKAYDIDEDRIVEILCASKGLCLEDPYWIVEEGFDGQYADYNFFENDISEKVSEIAFTGKFNEEDKPYPLSPEINTNGSLKKCWKKKGDEIILYKASSYQGLESYSEYYAYQIAKELGLNAIEYDLTVLHDEVVSSCKLFTSIDKSYIPISSIINRDNLFRIDETANYLSNLRKDLYEDFCSMLVFDAIIKNTDRHFGNFGFLVDNKTNDIISFVPLFDHGSSLYCYVEDKLFDEKEKFAEHLHYHEEPSLYSDFIETAAKYIPVKLIPRLNKLLDFKFKKHPLYNLSDCRLKKIENLVHKNVQDIIDSITT